MPTLTALNPAQWQLLLRAHARSGPVTDVWGWIWGSNAEFADVADLQDSKHIYATVGGTETKLVWTAGERFVDHQVRLTSAGNRVADRLVNQHRLLAHLDGFQIGVRLQMLLDGGIDWDSLLTCDDAGLIEGRRLGEERQTPLVKVKGTSEVARRLQGNVLVKATAKGRRYAARTDV